MPLEEFGGFGMPMVGMGGFPGFGMPTGGMPMMPMGGMVVMSIQLESSPIDNIMSSLMSPLINNLFNSGNRNISHMPQISSIPEKFLSLNYE